MFAGPMFGNLFHSRLYCMQVSTTSASKASICTPEFLDLGRWYCGDVVGIASIHQCLHFAIKGGNQICSFGCMLGAMLTL